MKNEEMSITTYGKNNEIKGDGSKENPYLITTSTHLTFVAEKLKANFMLMNDIDLSENEN